MSSYNKDNYYKNYNNINNNMTNSISNTKSDFNKHSLINFSSSAFHKKPGHHCPACDLKSK